MLLASSTPRCCSLSRPEFLAQCQSTCAVWSCEMMGTSAAGVHRAILEGISSAWPRTTAVTLPLDPDVVFKVCGFVLTLPLLQVQSEALIAGGFACVTDAPVNKPNPAPPSPPPPAARDPCSLTIGALAYLANMDSVHSSSQLPAAFLFGGLHLGRSFHQLFRW